MTGLEFPTEQDKMQAQFAMQNPQMNPQIAEQAEEILSKPTWEEIKEVLESDLLRNFSITIETDSTLHEEMTDNKKEISELLQSVVGFMESAAPMVSAGVLPKKAAKALLMAGVRRFKLGTEVEDALDEIGEQEQQGQQQQDPLVMQQQIEMQRMQQDHAQKMELMQAQMQADAQKHQMKIAEIQAQSQAEVVKQQAQMQDKLMTGAN